MFVDNKLADILVNRTDIFANIHPNIISIISIVCNIALYFILAPSLENQQIHVGAFTIVLIMRCLTDILDGAVARKYNKTSRLGGLLDTLGDVMLLLLLGYYGCRRYDLHFGLCWVLLGVIIGSIYSLDLYHDHAAAKMYEGHVGRQMLAFLTNNTVIVFAVVYFVILRGGVCGGIC